MIEAADRALAIGLMPEGTRTARGVSEMTFHKKCGLRIEDVVRSRWVYRNLRNFHAGIEAGISYLKRAYGLARCTWRGLERSEAYVWSPVVAYKGAPQGLCAKQR